MNAAIAPATVPPWAVMKAGLYVEATVRSNVIKYVPVVTPSGNPGNVGTAVATIAFVPGSAQQWI
jgi:hypothetical protein